jgi:hypothetical protein
LRQIEVQLAQGKSIALAGKEVEISDEGAHLQLTKAKLEEHSARPLTMVEPSGTLNAYS